MGNNWPVLTETMKAEIRRMQAEKAESGSEETADEDRKRRGVAAQMRKVAPDSRVYPLEQQGEGGPRIADEGSDALGREYSDAVMSRIAGAWSSRSGAEQSPIPEAGGSVVFEGDSRDVPDSGARFTEGDGWVGQEPRRGPFSPNMGKGPGSYDLDEDIVPEGGAMVPASLPGGMRIMSPQASGLAPAAGFVKPEPVQKSERKVGVFKSAIFGNRGDQADGFLGDVEE
jgi:hypothetical protein